MNAAVDIAARGLALRAGQSATVPTLAQAISRDLDPMGEAQAILTADRGLYVASASPPDATELEFGFAFTDAGGRHWMKPPEGVCEARDYGIEASAEFDEWGNPSGGPDQTPRLQALLYRVSANGGGTVRFGGLRGAVMLAASVIVPAGVNLDGAVNIGPYDVGLLGTLRFASAPDGQFRTSNGGLVSVANDGNCQAGVLFWCNIDPDASGTWIAQFPNAGSGTIENMSIEGGGTYGIRGFRFAGSHTFRNIRGNMVATLIEKPSMYCDAVRIERVHAEIRANADDYLINMPGLGDGIVIDQVAAGYTWDGTSAGTPRGVSLATCRGGRVANLINGYHRFKGCLGVTIDNPHIENGQIEIDAAEATISGGMMLNGNGTPVPIVVKNSQDTYRNACRVTINDVTFVHFMNGSQANKDGWSATQQLDIDLQSNRIDLVLNGGNRRVGSISGSLSRKFHVAPLIGDSTGGGVLGDWLAYAAMLATEPCTIHRKRISVSGSMPSRLADWNGLINSPFTSPNLGSNSVTYKGASGTNRYLARPLIDQQRGLARDPAASPTITIDVTSGSTTLPGFKPAQNSTTTGPTVWEVLRDTGDTGMFDKRALVPAVDLDWFVDDGNAIATFAWESYGPSAVAPAVNPGGLCGPMHYVDGVVTILDSETIAAPATGIWAKGDRIRFPGSEPHAGGVKTAAAVCRAGGASGTWDFQRIATA